MKYLVAFLALIPMGIVCGGGLRLVTQDAFAAGRGEAFVATASNASAIYYNPAGLGFLEDSEVRLGVYNLYFEPEFESSLTGEQFGIEKNFAVAPSFFLSHPIGESEFSFGLGIYAPYGAAVEWPVNTGFWSVAHSGSLFHVRLNPVLAWRVSDNFSVAAGLQVDYAEISLEQGLSRTEGPLGNIFRFEGDGRALGYNLGALWKPDPQWSVGVTFRSGTRIRFEGNTDVWRQPVISRQSFPADSEFDFPFTAVVGISWRPTAKWNLEYNADYTGWNSFDRTEIRQTGSVPSTVSQNIDVNFEWENSWIHSLGITRYLGSEWQASVGYVFSQNSVSDTYYNPLIADLDRHFLTIGAGRRGENWDFDVAYQFGFARDHRVEGSLPGSTPSRNFGQNGDGIYDFTSHAVAVSFGYRY